MHDLHGWWLSTVFLLMSTGGTLLYLHGKTENEVKMAKGIMDALLALWSVGSILALMPKAGIRTIDIRIAIQELPAWLSVSLIAVVLLLVSSKIAIAIVEARLAQRKVREEIRRRLAAMDTTNTVPFTPKRERPSRLEHARPLR